MLKKQLLKIIFCLFSIQNLWCLSSQADTLFFKEKEGIRATLDGELQGIDGNVVYWKHPSAQDTLSIDIHAVSTIEAAGKVLSLDEKEMVFKTQSGEETRVDRSTITSLIHPSIKITGILYHGPKNDKDWETLLQRRRGIRRNNATPQKTWRYQDNKFYLENKKEDSPSILSLSKNILPADNYVLSFTIEKKEPSFALKIYLGSYMLELDSELSAYQPGGKKYHGKLQLAKNEKGNFQEFNKEKVHIMLYYHHWEKAIHVYANSKKIASFDAIQAGFGDRERLSFNHIQKSAPLALYDIRLYQWDGETKGAPSLLTQKNEDQIALANGHCYSGDLKRIQSGKLLLEMKAGKKEIGLHSIKELFFKKKEEKTSPVVQRKKKKKAPTPGADYFTIRFSFPSPSSSKNHASAASDVLLFKNGNQLFGSPKTIRDGTVIWEKGPLLRPVSFVTKDLKKVKIADRGFTQDNKETYIKLINGNFFTGTIQKLTKDSVHVRTSYLGEINIPRSSVEGIGFLKEKSSLSLYEGIRRENEWQKIMTKDGFLQAPQPGWVYENGGFHAHTKGWIIKEVNTPQRVALEFDLSWRAAMDLDLILFAEKGKNLEELKFSKKYVFNLRTSSEDGGKWLMRAGMGMGVSGNGELLYYDPDKDYYKNPQDPTSLRKGSGYAGGIYALGGTIINPGIRVIGEATGFPIDAIGEEGNSETATARIGIYVDKAEGTFTLTANNELVFTWRDTDIAEGTKKIEGDFIAFFSNGHSSSAPIKMRVENIKISHWNGFLPGQTPAHALSTEDTLFLDNGDKVRGKIKKFGEKTVTIHIKDLSEPLEIARHNIEKLLLGRAKEEAAKKQAGEVKVFFTGGETVTMQVEKIEKGKVSGTHQTMGKIAFDLSALREIQFISDATPKPVTIQKSLQ